MTRLENQFADLLPTPQDTPPLGCPRPRVPDRLIFDQLVQVLVFGCGYHRIAHDSCSATTPRRRRDEWTDARIMARLQVLVLDAYDRMIGLELSDLAVAGCMTKAPCGGKLAGRSSVDRGKQGLKRSTVVGAHSLPPGAVAAPANQHDSPLLEPMLATLDRLGPLPDVITVHLDCGDDSLVTREHLAARGMYGKIAERSQSAPDHRIRTLTRRADECLDQCS